MLPHRPLPIPGPSPPAALDLRTRYRAWLKQPAPWEPTGSRVAGDRICRGLAQGETWGQTTQKAWAELQDAVRRTPDRVWFWSDLHLWHTNICRYAGRPFGNVDHMNEHLLAQAALTVGETDWLVFLGDLTFGKEDVTKAWLDRCPGRKAIVLGNHDVDEGKPEWKRLWRRFAAVEECVALDLATPVTLADEAPAHTLWLTHYPLWGTWVPEGIVNLHGHIHQHTLPGRHVNLSVEHTAYGPRRLTEVLAGYAALTANATSGAPPPR
jgi:calcineurin-like phosphoesterase family protein